MPTVADALRQHLPAYLDTFGERVPLGHRKVLSQITRCRTGELGDVIYRCKSCDRTHWVGRSCGNRHCPNCQKQKTSLWLARQTEKLLPVQHFVVTFTVPQELRPLLRANQRAGYEAIFKAGSQTIRTLLAREKNLGSDKLGFFGVLHTWGRDPRTFHPHVHFVVPGGGVSPDGKSWRQVRADHLFHPRPAMMLYKKLFVEAIRKAGLYDQLPPGVLKKNWVVNIKPVGDGRAVLKYLAPYVYRVALSDNRIVSVDKDGVTFRVRPSGTSRWVTRRASGNQFVAAFARHILPSGFQKVRYYGWMSPNCKLQLARVRWLVWLWRGWTYWLGSAAFQPTVEPPRLPSCRHCGGELELMAITNEVGDSIWLPPLSARGPPCATSIEKHGSDQKRIPTPSRSPCAPIARSWHKNNVPLPGTTPIDVSIQPIHCRWTPHSAATIGLLDLLDSKPAHRSEANPKEVNQLKGAYKKIHEREPVWLHSGFLNRALDHRLTAPASAHVASDNITTAPRLHSIGRDVKCLFVIVTLPLAISASQE